MTALIVTLMLVAFASFMAGNFARYFCVGHEPRPTLSKAMAVSTLLTLGGAIFLFMVGLGWISIAMYKPRASAASAALLGITYFTLQVADELRKPHDGK